jgi:hypothetical protein
VRSTSSGAPRDEYYFVHECMTNIYGTKSTCLYLYRICSTMRDVTSPKRNLSSVQVNLPRMHLNHASTQKSLLR